MVGRKTGETAKSVFEFIIAAAGVLTALLALYLQSHGSPAAASVAIGFAVFLLVLMGLYALIGEPVVGWLSIVYENVKPVSSGAKVIVLVFSILYGFLAFYLLGPYSFLPFFWDPHYRSLEGIEYYAIVMIVLLIIYFVIAWILKKAFDPKKNASTYLSPPPPPPP